MNLITAQDPKQVKCIYIQSGYCVFGAGSDRAEAIADARMWLEDDETGQQGTMSLEAVENLISTQPVDGNMALLFDTDNEFDSYLESQGGYSKINGKWFDDEEG